MVRYYYVIKTYREIFPRYKYNLDEVITGCSADSN